MKAIIHYRDVGWYDSEDRINVTVDIVGFLVEGAWSTIVDIMPYEFEIDNPADYNEGDDKKFMNCFLILDLKEEWIQDWKNNLENINNAFFAQLDSSPPMVTQHWLSFNEQFFIVEMDRSNPPVGIDAPW